MQPFPPDSKLKVRQGQTDVQVTVERIHHLLFLEQLDVGCPFNYLSSLNKSVVEVRLTVHNLRHTGPDRYATENSLARHHSLIMRSHRLVTSDVLMKMLI